MLSKICDKINEDQKRSFKNGDLVWAMCDQQIWKPAIVWQHDKENITSNVTANTVYFLDCIKKKQDVISDICQFQGLFETNKDNKFHSNDPVVLKSAQQAADLLEVDPAKRMQKLEKVLLQSHGGSNSDEYDYTCQLNLQQESKLNQQDKQCSNATPRQGSVKKYRKIIYSDSESENASDNNDESFTPDVKPVDGRLGRILSSKEDEDSTVEDEEVVTPGKKRKRGSAGFKPTKPSVTQVKSKLLSFQASSELSLPTEATSSYLHETLDFLLPDKLQDANGNKPGSPDYDNSTLKVPGDFLKKQTPAMYQWWTIKSKHFDVVLFFKVGKFYELYHMDATIGVKELGLIYMKGNYAHSGFPEVAYGRYSAALVQKGYSVARVEQTETPDQNSQRIREKSLSKYDKTLRREVCRITTMGTQTYNAWEQSGGRNQENNFLLAVTERPLYGSTEQSDAEARREIGVCFVDTSVGVFHLNQFKDDRSCSRFRTMISHYYPCQVLFERGKLSSELSKILHTGLASVIQTALSSGTQFWDSGKCLKTLSKQKYFVKNNEEEVWPDVLDQMRSDTDSLGLSAKVEYELALSSLGACIFYLKKCLVDFEVISMGQFVLYQCEDEKTNELVSSANSNFPNINQRMILDSTTLANLEVLQNSKGTKDGSLLQKIDSCKTAFGRRLLRQWICAPPCHPHVVNARLDAIDDLMANNNIMTSVCDTLLRMPDLERMLAQIHSLSKGSRSPDHPDSRAILYEEKLYSKRKINDFMCILEHYQAMHKCLKNLQNRLCDLKSLLLRKILCFVTNQNYQDGVFPDMEETLMQWKKAFDHKMAKETGKIIPNLGTNPEYDQAVSDVKSILERSESYLKEQKKIFSCSQIVYKGSGNKRFQLEIPNDRVSKRIPDEYEISGQRKGFKSFKTNYTVKLVKEVEEAESRRNAAQADSMAIIFREFSKDYMMWNAAVQCLAQLDVIVSFTLFSKGSDGVMCRPEILLPETCPHAMLDIREGRHPCVTKTLFSEDFIPNHTQLGCIAYDMEEHDESTMNQCLLLTGPNMGGKSTLMRQLAAALINDDRDGQVVIPRYLLPLAKTVLGHKSRVGNRIEPSYVGGNSLVNISQPNARLACSLFFKQFTCAYYVGLLAILAHMGTYVPAQACRLTSCDRIFTRLGAFDRIMSGESTFFVELDETSTILKHASRHSLVLLDELGRGTSTYDGTAIASAVLKDVAEFIRCRTVFSTHYRTLVDDASSIKNVQLGHMACMVEDGDSPVEEVLTFLYKLAGSACPKSYGFHAALLAGVDDDVVKLAHAKAVQLEAVKNDIALFKNIFNHDLSKFRSFI